MPNFDDLIAGKVSTDEIRYQIFNAGASLFQNQPLPENKRKLLGQVLMKIGMGESADKAFLLKAGAKRKNPADIERTFAFWVWRFVHTEDYTVENAIAKVASLDHWKILKIKQVQDGAIRRYYNKHKNKIDQDILSALSSNKKSEPV